MCGIAGKIHFSPDHAAETAVVHEMVDRITHRGPDDDGFFFEGPVGLGMRRLSVIDLAGGKQPLQSEDGNVQLVYNGEIYNFAELRRDLEARGHRFATRSDGEVIVHLYEEKGTRCVEDLRGMFAFALWDRSARRLLLARDRVGKKPLCWARLGDRLLFGSEIKSLLADPALVPEVDLEGLDLFLAFQFIPAPRTAYRGVYKLPPGHLLIWEPSGLRVERWWELPTDRPAAPSFADAVVGVRERIEDAVRVRLVSDVPIGAFLSGGLDSSTVVGMMAKKIDEPVHTFSIGFEDERYDELPFARIAANAFGTRHSETTVRPDLVENLPKLGWHFDEPFADHSALPTFLLCREAAKELKVVLSGDGGDEGFAGYGRYADAGRRHLAGWIGSAAGDRLGRRLLQDLFDGRGSRLGHRLRRTIFRRGYAEAASVFYATSFDGGMKQRLLRPEIRAALGRAARDQLLERWEEARAATPSILDRMLRFDFSWYLAGDLLPKVDIASMAHGLEVRSPLLDHHLLEYLFRLPPEFKVRDGQTKILLKKAAAELVPAELIDRPKKGFGVPMRAWLRGPLRELLSRELGKPSPAVDTFFRRDEVERLLGEHLSGRRNHATRLWGLLVFARWHRRFIEGRNG